jgi:hypothetical protein
MVRAHAGTRAPGCRRRGKDEDESSREQCVTRAFVQAARSARSQFGEYTRQACA